MTPIATVARSTAEYMLQSTDAVPFTAFMVDRRAALHIVFVPGYPEIRNAAIAFLKWYALVEEVAAYAVTCEAWQGKRADLPPSQDPDAVDVVVVAGRDQNGPTVENYVIQKTDDGRRSIEGQVSTVPQSGDVHSPLCELLPPPGKVLTDDQRRKGREGIRQLLDGMPEGPILVRRVSGHAADPFDLAKWMQRAWRN